MARRCPPRKVTSFEPVAPRLARNTIIESRFEVGRRFRCTMRIDCGPAQGGGSFPSTQRLAPATARQAVARRLRQIARS